MCASKTQYLSAVCVLVSWGRRAAAADRHGVKCRRRPSLDRRTGLVGRMP